MLHDGRPQTATLSPQVRAAMAVMKIPKKSKRPFGRGGNMREILFRGKRSDAKELVYWGVYGKFTATQRGKLVSGKFGLTDWVYELLTDFDSIDQHFGRDDKNGNKIFENDLVKTKYGRICQVVWFEPKLCWDLKPVANLDCKSPDEWDLWDSENLEVIGNIWDNPELLEATK